VGRAFSGGASGALVAALEPNSHERFRAFGGDSRRGQDG